MLSEVCLSIYRGWDNGWYLYSLGHSRCWRCWRRTGSRWAVVTDGWRALCHILWCTCYKDHYGNDSLVHTAADQRHVGDDTCIAVGHAYNSVHVSGRRHARQGAVSSAAHISRQRTCTAAPYTGIGRLQTRTALCLGTLLRWKPGITARVQVLSVDIEIFWWQPHRLQTTDNNCLGSYVAVWHVRKTESAAEWSVVLRHRYSKMYRQSCTRLELDASDISQRLDSSFLPFPCQPVFRRSCTLSENGHVQIQQEWNASLQRWTDIRWQR